MKTGINTINQIFDSISDEDLQIAITEIKEAEKTGRFDDFSRVRSYTEKVIQITGSPYSTELFNTQVSLLRQASYRWFKMLNPQIAF